MAANYTKLSEEEFKKQVDTMFNAITVVTEKKFIGNGGYNNWLNMHQAPMAFSKLSMEKNPIFLGFEWEVSYENYDPDTDADTEPQFVHAILSSPCKDFLNPRSGGDPTELVSVPASLLWHKRMMSKHFFKNNFHKDFDFQPSDDNGIHVHISKKAFTKESLYNFIMFICRDENRKFIESISGRDMYDCGWCAPNTDSEFTSSEDPDKDGELIIDDDLRQESENVDCKSIAVNTWTSFDTVELRIFANATTEQSFFSKLEFTEAAIYFSRKYKDEKDLTEENFRKFLKRYKRRYNNLIKHLG